MASEALINHRMNGGEWLALLLLSVLWGGSFFFAAVLIKRLAAIDGRVFSRIFRRV